MSQNQTQINKYSMYTKAQRRAIESDESCILVSASAGSGKTTVMIERILRLIDEGASLNQMVICTFTKAAAADMRGKLLNKLSKKAADGDKNATSALKMLPSAEISTIHSWCNRLIKTYFYLADIDPAMELMDEVARGLMLSSCVDEVVDRYIMDDSDDFRTLHSVLKSARSDENFRKVITKLFNYAVIRSGSESWIESIAQNDSSHEQHLKFISEYYENGRLEIMKSLQNIRLECEMAKFEKGIATLETMVSEIENWKSQSRLNAKTQTPEQKNIVEEQIKPLRARYKKLLEKYEVDINSIDGAASSRNRKILSKITLDVFNLFKAQKLKKSQVDFSDLEHLTYKILSQPSSQELLKDKYKYLFVDEYQDINPLQDEIFSLLNVNRFYVGDIKQSIYAFRMCDPKIFADKIDACKSGEEGEVIILDANFRSDSEILSFCDSIFCDCMTKDFGSVDYAMEGKFVSGRGKLFSHSVICKSFDAKDLIDDDKDEGDSLDADGDDAAYNSDGGDDAYGERGEAVSGIYSVRDHVYSTKKTVSDCKANLVVDHILELMQTQFYDDEIGQERKVEYGDIAILMRSVESNFASTLIKKLHLASIPIAVKKEHSIKNNICVNLLIDYLSLVSNIHNDFAIASVMKSCLGGFFTDIDLVEIRTKTNSELDYRSTFVEAVKAYAAMYSDERSEKIKNLFSDIKHYKNLSYVLTAGELAGRICANLQLFKYALSLADGARMGTELAEFLSKVAALPSGTSLECALIDIEKLDIKLSALESQGGVKIMTIHASKGLEYPFVILTSIDSKIRFSDASQDCITNPMLGTALKHFDYENGTKQKTSQWVHCSLLEKKRMIEEEMRVLYVALSRAKYQLAIIAKDSKAPYFSASSASAPYDLMAKSFNQKSIVYGGSDCEDVVVKEHNNIIMGEPFEHLQKTVREYINFKYPFERQYVKVSVTAKARMDEEIETGGKQVYADYCAAKDTRATDIGNAYHKFLEIADLSGDFDLSWGKFEHDFVAWSALIKKENAQCAFNAIKNKVNGRKFYREKPFISKDSEGVLIQGVIDLLIVEGNVAEIIDYKSSPPKKEMLDIYSRQLGAYKSATKQILKIDKVKTSLFIVSTAEFVEI